jgi:hypothetical protein
MNKLVFISSLIVGFACASFTAAAQDAKAQPKSQLGKNLSDPRLATTPAPGVEARGDVIYCLTNPRFVTQLKGFSSKAVFSTSNRFQRGLTFEDQVGERPVVFQHPSWAKFGWLAVFSIPAPKINVLENVPAEQNRVYKVDANTGEMKLFAELPPAPIKNLKETYEQNPYGTIGIAYDCDTRLLYVTSIAGSTRTQEVGRIFAIDAQTAQIKHTLDKTDAMGVHLHKRDGEKRLYYGLLREPEVWSIAVDAQGKPTGTPRFELSIEGMGPRGDDRVRKIGFTPQNEMILSAIEFSVNLVAPTEKQQSIYRFVFDAKTKKWERKLDFPQQP